MVGACAEFETAELVQRVRMFDGDAETELYRRYIDRVLRILYRSLVVRFSSTIDPEDLSQSIFATLFIRLRNGKFDRFDFSDDTRFWKLLVTISLNKLRNKTGYGCPWKREAHRLLRESPAIETAELQMRLKCTTQEVTIEELESFRMNLDSFTDNGRRGASATRRGAGRQRINIDPDQLGKGPDLAEAIEFGDLLESLFLQSTPRQQKILAELLNGCTYMEIAAQLGVCEKTISRDVNRIRELLTRMNSE